MHPVFEDLHARYRKTLSGKDCATCQLRPAQSRGGKATSWTTQDVIEHLILTYRNTGEYLDRYLARKSPSQKPLRAKHRVLQFLVVRCGGFPRGVTAPEAVCPGKCDMSPMTGDELCACMRSELEKLDAQLDECIRTFDKTPFASHFALGPMTADQWRRFHFVHGRHHLKQLARIRKQTKAA
ncbi:MAG TPA: DUF1569 domain-containing protein [Terracidiphilus sp.]|nr:DUF1569 domain-containing protein [Terracidiphilus sp.]